MAGGKKEHVERIKKSEFNRQRNSDVLRDNCGNDGYVFIKKRKDKTKYSAGQSQIHHVLPVCTLQDGTIEVDTAEDRKYIRNCMAMTKWDCNEQPNLLGLPTKEPFEDVDRKVGEGKDLAFIQNRSAWRGQFGALPDLPCHLNEHDKYNAHLIKKLNADLWSRLISEREPCTVKGKDIKKLMEDMSNEWKDWLKTRGEGAADCWVNREKRPKWYFPLSMAPKPKKIKPPARYAGENAKEWLKNLFAAVTR
jgi:hypothetical protein